MPILSPHHSIAVGGQLTRPLAPLCHCVIASAVIEIVCHLVTPGLVRDPPCVAAAANSPAADDPYEPLLLPGSQKAAPTEARIKDLLKLHAQTSRSGTLHCIPGASYVTDVVAHGSSHSIWRDKVYRPWNAFDGDYRTAWVEGKRGHGVGEWIALDFRIAATRAPRLVGLLVVPGFAKNYFMFRRNNRPSVVRLDLVCAIPEAPAAPAMPSRALRRRLQIAQRRQPQLFVLTARPEEAQIVLAGTCRLTLTLERIARGTHYADTSLAEARLILYNAP